MSHIQNLICNIELLKSIMPNNNYKIVLILFFMYCIVLNMEDHFSHAIKKCFGKSYDIKSHNYYNFKLSKNI